jgi:hypothetical protein
MPMPTLIAKKYVMSATPRFFHEKQKSAAIAPTWNRPITIAVIQLTRPSWCSRPMRRSCFTFSATSAARRRAASISAGVIAGVVVAELTGRAASAVVSSINAGDIILGGPRCAASVFSSSASCAATCPKLAAFARCHCKTFVIGPPSPAGGVPLSCQTHLCLPSQRHRALLLSMEQCSLRTPRVHERKQPPTVSAQALVQPATMGPWLA